MGKKREVVPGLWRWVAEGSFANYLLLSYVAFLFTIAGYYLSKERATALVATSSPVAAVRVASDIGRGPDSTEALVATSSLMAAVSLTNDIGLADSTIAVVSPRSPGMASEVRVANDIAAAANSTTALVGPRSSPMPEAPRVGNDIGGGTATATTCDMFSGKWVFDSKSYPLYRDWNCSFMYDDLACEKYQRKDLKYQYWRWQPDHCDLPKFDAKALLEQLRNKRLMFVGDSLNRNQWVSMVCLVESSIPRGFKSKRSVRNLYRFNAKQYNASIDFYWAPLLVESNADNPSSHSFADQIVRIKSIEKHAKHWADADILIFNSYHWWGKPKVKIIKRGLIGNSNATHREMEARKVYQMALKTWSKWVLAHVNRSKTRLFWMSMSTSHNRRENWGKRAGDRRRCMNETVLIAKEKLRGSETDPKMMRMTEAAIGELQRRGVNIHLLNITQLSAYRKDAHPTIYRKLWRPLTEKQLADPTSYADCTHWCLPGVPDVWNRILYAYLLH